MAARPKRVVRKISRYEEEYPSKRLHTCSHEATWKKGDLYDVEIVEKDHQRKMVKIHYVGYSTKYDRWIPNTDGTLCPLALKRKLTLPSPKTMEERFTMFCQKVRISIKQKLWSHRLNNPEVKIQIEVDEDVFQNFVHGLPTLHWRGQKYVVPESISDLDQNLGKGWHQRIFNSAGDFAYVVDNTLKIKMTRKQPIKEFLYQGGAYVEVANEQQPTIDLVFVRGDGNRTLYERRR